VTKVIVKKTTAHKM